MRPYLAIIRDSFREALSTKMLWVILLLCLAFLAILLPFSVTEYFPARYDWKEVGLADGAFEAFKEPKTDAEKHVAKVAATIPELATVDKKQDSDRVMAMMTVLNTLLNKPELYDPISMKDLKDSVARDLIDKGIGSLDGDELAQLNRRILAELYPKALPLPDGYRCDITYAGGSFYQAMLSKSMVLDAGILGFATYSVSFFGVFLPLLFTAGMIPRAFESGSVEMTLSKPIRRSYVFIAKFLGGCSFAFIMAAVIAVGIFLIAGFRLDYWQWRLLLCIPVFVFNFSVYYTISAYVGLAWRNTVMALFFALGFVVLCFGIGKTKQVADEMKFMPNVPTHVELVGDDVLTSTAGGAAQRWNTVANTWEGGGDFFGMAAIQTQNIRYVGPIYDPKGERTLRMDTMSNNVLVGDEKNQFAERSGPMLQPGTIDLVRHPDGTVYFIAGHGISRFVKGKGGKETIKSCSPMIRCGRLAYASLNPTNGDIVVCGNKRLVVLARKKDGTYAVKTEADGLEKKRLVVGFLGARVVGVDEDGVVHVFDENLEETHTLTPVKNESPRTMATSKDGETLFMLYHNQELWSMRSDKPAQARKAKVAGQGSITAVTVQRDGRIAIGWDLNRVTVYDASLKRVKTYRPKMDRFETFYRFGLVPVYTLFPKPTEISNFTTYLITGKRSHQHGRDASVFRPRINIWQPIWSCAIFVVVILGMGCYLIRKRDF